MKTYTLIAAVMITIIAGCGVQKRDPAEKTTYLLNIERPSSNAAPQSAVCLSIAPCKAVSPFSGRSLVYRTGPVQYEQDYYNLFLTGPDEQISEAMQQWFFRAGYENCHVAGGSTNSETMIYLFPKLDVFCTDFEHRDNPVATVRMHVSFAYYHLTSGQDALINKAFSAETPLPAKPTAAQVVEGLSVSLSQIFKQLETELQTERISGS